MTTKDEQKPALKPTKILRCKNPECKAWIRDIFTDKEQLEQTCPICKGPMLRSMKHLPPVQNKIKRAPRKKND
ncbi:cold-inducible protein YdjO-related protein [Paenibacillus sp. HB172176]|uniref:cold-inducible protein YdjO-related protein n=1 Tax=Paenibacillus sp. HB172176 TaxID=2493690 RepID=UPI00143C364A|nr:cold-inducible protein YdjO-related protein [Paenibacillus sp. HB172176]